MRYIHNGYEINCNRRLTRAQRQQACRLLERGGVFATTDLSKYPNFGPAFKGVALLLEHQGHPDFRYEASNGRIWPEYLVRYSLTGVRAVRAVSLEGAPPLP